MVILRQLETRDFKHLDLAITFPQGILAISGPNESGKSSIFEAILFALFGRTHKAPMGQKDRLINYDAEKLFVRLSFDIEGTLFRITRQIHRKRPSQAQLHKISSSGEAKLLATGVKNVDKEVAGLLNGITLSDLLASNIVLQKDLDRLAQMPKMERRHVINAMMGRECFSRADDKLTLELRPLKKALESEKETLQQLRLRRDEVLKQREEHTTKRQALTQLEKQLKQISQDLAKSEQTHVKLKAYKNVKEEQDELQRELQYQVKTQDRLQKQIKNLSKLKSQQKKLLTQQKQLDYLKEDKAKFERFRESSVQLRKLVDKQQVIREGVLKLENQIQGFTGQKDLMVEYEQVKIQRRKVEVDQRRFFSPLIYVPPILLLGAGIGVIFFNLLLGGVLFLAAIPFLGYIGRTYYSYKRAAPHLDQLRKREELLSEQLAQYRAKETFETQLQEQRTRDLEITSQIQILAEQVQKQLKQFSSAVLEGIKVPMVAEISEQLETMRAIEQKLLELEAGAHSIRDRIATIEEQLAGIIEAQEDLASAKTKMNKLQKQLATLKFPEMPEEVGAYSDALFEKFDQQVRELREAKVRFQANQKSINERIQELTAFLENSETILDEYSVKEREVAHLDENTKSGSRTIELIREVAERGREQVRPRVESVMERLLATITDGKYRFPKLSEDYSLKVYSAIAGEFVEANLYSGGTEDQFLLALRLGFALALLPHGRGTAPQFLLLDEPFAGSDIQRRNNIIRLLQDELSRTFDQIIVVSHQSAVLSASEHQFRMVNGRIIHSD